MITLNFRKTIDQVFTFEPQEQQFQCSECLEQNFEMKQCQNCIKRNEFHLNQLINFPIELTESQQEVFTDTGDNISFSDDGHFMAQLIRRTKDQFIIISTLPLKEQVLEILTPKSKLTRCTSLMTFTQKNDFFIYRRQFGKEIDLFIYNIHEKQGKSFYFQDSQMQKYWSEQKGEMLVLFLKYSTKQFELYKLDKNFNFIMLNQVHSSDSFLHLIQGNCFLSNYIGFFIANLQELQLLNSKTLKQIKLFKFSEIYNAQKYSENFLFVRPRKAEQKTFMNQIRNNKIIRIIDIENENSLYILNLAIFQYTRFNQNEIIFYDIITGRVDVKVILDNEFIINIRCLGGFLTMKIQGIYKGWKIKSKL